jgi:hypothetical protein
MKDSFMVFFNVLPWQVPGRIEKNTKKLSVYSVTRPKFEHRKTRIRNRNANHSARRSAKHNVKERMEGSAN